MENQFRESYPTPRQINYGQQTTKKGKHVQFDEMPAGVDDQQNSSLVKSSFG
jgi:hypothetical protein